MEPADSDSLAMVKNAAHANATKICLNWPLSREGPEIVSRLRKYAPGVLTSIRWLQDTGVNAAKDRMSVEEFLQVENQSEEKLNEIRAGAEIRAGCIEGIQLFRSKGLSADG